MLRRRAVSAALAALTLAAGLCAATPGHAAEHMIGTSCSSDTNNADWDTIGQCISGTFVRAPYVLGSAAASAQSSCSTYTAGTIRYNTTLANLEVCDGSTWQAVGNTSTTCGSPSGLSFTNVTGATLSTLYTSGSATITFSGCSSSLSVSVTGGGSPQISVNGGGWTTSGSIYSGQTLQVRLTSSGSGSTLLTATVTVAATSTNWTVTTAALDPCTGTATPPSLGAVCIDGSLYAGITPDTSVPMYAAPCDYGLSGSAGACSGTRGTLKWSAGTTVTTGITNQSTGKANTLALHNDDGNADTPYSAADYCYNLSGYLGHSDWYLPAPGELNLLYQNYAALGGSGISGFNSGVQYWSSSENSSGGAWYEVLSSGSQTSNFKNLTEDVRCVRHN